MLRRKHFMADLETMDTAPTAAIVSIGLVYFDDEKVLDQFYTPISLSSSLEAGLTKSQSTMDWWAKQSPEARSAWQTPDAPPLLNGLTKMVRWMEAHTTPKTTAIWGNGASFDVPILESAFRAVGANAPWDFWNHMCFRTVKSMFPDVGAMPRAGTHHNALDDAMHQVQHLLQIIKVKKLDIN